MADFIPISSVRTQPDAPVDTTLMTNLADNDVHVNERMGTPTDGGLPTPNHAHLGFDQDGTAQIAGTTGGISIVSGSYIGIGDTLGINLTRFKPEFMMILKLARIGETGSPSPQIKHDGDLENFSTPLSGLGGKTNLGVSRLRLGGALFIGGSPQANSPNSKYTTLLLKSNPKGIKKGIYTGNTDPTQQIQNIGFQPSVVLVWRATSTVNSIPVIKTIGMTGTNSKDFGGNSGSILASNGIISLDIDGFTVGNSSRVNNNNVDYAFLAFKSFTDSGESIQVDSYVGDGNNPRNPLLVNSANFAPHWAWIINTNVSGSSRSLVLASVEMTIALATDNPLMVSTLVLEMLENGIDLTNDNHVNALNDNYDIIWFLSGVRP